MGFNWALHIAQRMLACGTRSPSWIARQARTCRRATGPVWPSKWTTTSRSAPTMPPSRRPPSASHSVAQARAPHARGERSFAGVQLLRLVVRVVPPAGAPQPLALVAAAASHRRAPRLRLAQRLPLGEGRGPRYNGSLAQTAALSLISRCDDCIRANYRWEAPLWHSSDGSFSWSIACRYVSQRTTRSGPARRICFGRFREGRHSSLSAGHRHQRGGCHLSSIWLTNLSTSTSAREARRRACAHRATRAW